MVNGCGIGPRRRYESCSRVRGAPYATLVYGGRRMAGSTGNARQSLITRYVVIAANPRDEPELPTSLAHHQTRSCAGGPDRRSRLLHVAHDLCIDSIALPR